MGSSDSLRLFVLCFWLLIENVNCEKSQREDVQAGQAPLGVFIDNRDYKRWREPSSFRGRAAGYRKQSGKTHPAEQHPSASKSQFPSYSPNTPETQASNVLTSQGRYFDSRPGPSFQVSSTFGHKTVSFPNGKRTRGSSANSNMQAIKFSMKTRSAQTDARPTRHRHPFNRKMDTVIKGHSPGSHAAGRGSELSHQAWSPRAYSSDVSEGKGYAHVRRLKPGFDKTRPHNTTAKYPGSRDSTKVSSDTRLELKYNSRGTYHLPQERVLIQGKFKPFQRLTPTNLSSNHLPDMAPQEVSETLLFDAVNGTAPPTVSGNASTASASSMQTEGTDTTPQAPGHQGQSESPAEMELSPPSPEPPSESLAAEPNGEGEAVSAPEPDLPTDMPYNATSINGVSRK